ncbi:Hypothetical_protein [Hexamita inflata]|uniref:Hypothetical_protein n=1 Tax=Hexamita inflata TaxID=28002 RepID=A0AA86TXB3_9EUKA|nr:Hypothetical protein HINF_LOCUS12153 [Hexamita inflata]
MCTIIRCRCSWKVQSRLIRRHEFAMLTKLEIAQLQTYMVRPDINNSVLRTYSPMSRLEFDMIKQALKNFIIQGNEQIINARIYQVVDLSKQTKLRIDYINM